MLAQGFTVAFLASLVREGFVTAELKNANVVWVEITDLGREVLAAVSRPPVGQSRRRAL
jgi:DNA-binding PadR family transcriptional regulator